MRRLPFPARWRCGFAPRQGKNSPRLPPRAPEVEIGCVPLTNLTSRTSLPMAGLHYQFADERCGTRRGSMRATLRAQRIRSAGILFECDSDMPHEVLAVAI